MARGPQLNRDERVIVAVTPAPWGLGRPIALTLVLSAGVVFAGLHVHLLHHYEADLWALLVGPPALLVLTRVLRWRSNKILVTSEQLHIEAGVLRHTRTSIGLDDIAIVDVEQRLHDRIRRRGVVRVTTATTAIYLGPVHHPDALARVIDQARRTRRPSSVPYDTIFEPTLPNLGRDERRANRRRP